MGADFVLGVKFKWHHVDADLSKCVVCKEPIFYKMHHGYLEVADEKIQTELKLCDACFNAMELEK